MASRAWVIIYNLPDKTAYQADQLCLAVLSQNTRQKPQKKNRPIPDKSRPLLRKVWVSVANGIIL
jgi:hypothetical protein